MSISHSAKDYQTDFKRGPHWNHESPFLPVGWDSTPPDCGARSLRIIARRKLLADQSALSPELFKSVPWKIAKELWEYLGACEKQTLYFWKIMASNYPEFRMLSPSYHLSTGACKLPLRQYIDVINDEECHWRAVLSISTAYTDVSDLVAISGLKNLVALEINKLSTDSPPQSHQLHSPDKACMLHDGLIRSWVETMEAKGTLKHLRVLRLRGQTDISPHILPMLHKLPQLQVIVLYDCDLFTEAITRSLKDKGSEMKINGWIARRLDCKYEHHADDQERELRETLLNAYTRSCGTNNYDIEGVRPPKPPSLQTDIPLMEFQLPRTFEYGREKYARGGKKRAMTRSVILLVKCLEGIPSERKRSSRPDDPGPGKRRKHTMKERAGQDLAGVLGQFM